MLGSKAKQSWYITDSDDDDLLGPVALRDRWQDADGTPCAACAIVTTSAATDDLRTLHGRMPLLLPRVTESAWFDCGLTEPRAVLSLREHPDAARLRLWPVSPAVNCTGYSDPA